VIAFDLNATPAPLIQTKPMKFLSECHWIEQGG
jgi:hypothetical protein